MACPGGGPKVTNGTLHGARGGKKQMSGRRCGAPWVRLGEAREVQAPDLTLTF